MFLPQYAEALRGVEGPFNRQFLMKLGKHPAIPKPKRDPRTLKLKNYRVTLESQLPTAPLDVSWVTRWAASEPIQMFGNDELGDCVEAAAGHIINQSRFYAGLPGRVTQADVIAAYSGATGYIPGNPNTDNGTDMFSFCKYWQNTGIGGHKIIAYIEVDWTDDAEVQLAIDLFGNTFTGIALPTSAQGQNAWTVTEGGIYSPNGQPGGWGGHGIPLFAGSQITDTCATWGTTLKMSKNFKSDYVDEMYTVLSADWIGANGLSPSLLNLPLLQNDLNELGVQYKLPRAA